MQNFKNTPPLVCARALITHAHPNRLKRRADAAKYGRRMEAGRNTHIGEVPPVSAYDRTPSTASGWVWVQARLLRGARNPRFGTRDVPKAGIVQPA